MLVAAQFVFTCLRVFPNYASVSFAHPADAAGDGGLSFFYGR